MAFLVVFDHDWGDEFNVNGFHVFANFKEVEECMGRFFEEGFHFGTNEAFEPEDLNIDDLDEYFSITEIPDEVGNEIMRAFGLLKFSGRRPFGNFPL